MAWGADGLLRFVDAGGARQILYPAFLEPQTQADALDSASHLAVRGDGTADVRLFGRSLRFLPDFALDAIPLAAQGQPRWQDGPIHFAIANRQRQGTAQGLGVP